MVALIEKDVAVDPDQIRFQPTGDFILVEPIRRKQTFGGLALPDGAEIEPPRGKVVKAGPGRVSEEGKLLPMSVGVGDEVYMHFVYQQPMSMTFFGKEYVLVRARDVVGLAT